MNRWPLAGGLVALTGAVLAYLYGAPDAAAVMGVCGIVLVVGA